MALAMKCHSPMAGREGGFFLFSAFAALLLALPVLAVCAAWLAPAGDGSALLNGSSLWFRYAQNSLLIASLSGLAAFLIGTGSAWAVTMWEFPGRKALGWLLILPFAMPPYVAAMIYGYLLEGAGPVQTTWRDFTGLAFSEYYFPPVRSLGGVVCVLTFTLYPYVYLAARAAFTAQSQHMLETAATLGLSRIATFRRVALPLARPALIAGTALVVMEALGDFGVAALFGVPSFTTGIYRIWQGFYDPVTAARMASLLLLCVLAALWLERQSRGRARYDNPSGLFHPLPRHLIHGVAGWGISAACLVPLMLGFLIPLAVIVYFSAAHSAVFADSATWEAALHSLELAFLTAAVASLIALGFGYTLRRGAPPPVRALIALATSGYAIPGSIIAVGVLLFLITVQNDLLQGRLFLTGTLLGVLWGCSLRFLTVAFANIQAGLTRITPAMDAVAATLGAGKARILTALHLPLLRASLLSGFLLIFIDTLKELPATLLLRPFNFDTLAIRTYELAADELLPHAAPTALMLILVSLPPVWFLHHRLTHARPGETHE